MHFVLSNSNVTSSEAVLPILPNITLAERKKRLFGVIYHLNCRLFAMYVPI